MSNLGFGRNWDTGVAGRDLFIFPIPVFRLFWQQLALDILSTKLVPCAERVSSEC